MREHDGGPAVSDPIGALAALMAPEGRLVEALQLLLRAAPAPGARLRRAQGDPRDSGRRRRADADRNLAAAAAHARLDEGLPVVARGRRPGHRAGRSATASPIRCCASGCGCTAARRRPPKTTSPAKCTATRCRACRSSRNRANSRRSRVRHGVGRRSAPASSKSTSPVPRIVRLKPDATVEPAA